MKTKNIWLSLAGFFLLSLVLQSQMYTDWNLLFTLEGGRRLIKGGYFLKDLIDPNPPLIYYWAMGTAYLSKLSGLNDIFIFKLITYVLVFYSLCLSHYILGLCKSACNFRFFIIPALAFCLLILQIHSLGEREHLMLALVFPYFFLRYQSFDREPSLWIPKILGILISILASIGFAFKPYFLLPFIFAELLFVYWKKNWLNILQIEPVIIMVVQLIYWVYILFIMPASYREFLFLVLQFYASNKNSLAFIKNPSLWSTFILFGLFLFSTMTSKINQLFLVLSLSFTLSFILQGKGWYYQALPLMTVNLLFLTLLCYGFLLARQIKTLPVGILAGTLFLCLLKPLYISYKNLIACHNQDTCNYLPLIQLAKTKATNQPVYFFSTQMCFSIPIIYYSKTILASRFSTLWLLSGILNKEKTLGLGDTTCMAAKELLQKYIIEDFLRYEPRLVFVDISPQKAYIQGAFDYLNFMSTAPDFIKLWKKYKYMTTLNHFAIYQLKELTV